MKILFVLVVFLVYSLIFDLLIKLIYCSWKKKHNNGYRCYFWNCREWENCTYNGAKRRIKFFGRVKKGSGDHEKT